MGEMSFAFEPAWPWSIPHVGLPAMLGVALVLVGLTVWTYSGVRKATARRVGMILLLRLAALLIAFLAVLRPSFGVMHLEGVETSKLLVVFDQSESMNFADTADGATRWHQVKRLWESPAVKSRLDQLAAEQRIEVAAYLGANDLRPHDSNAKADGKRTDIGAWLKQLHDRHGHEKHLRGVALFSDGADNGTRFSVQQEAGKWRGICPVVAVGAGNPDDPKYRKDLALVSLDADPNPAPVKSKMRLLAKVHAPGFENTDVEAVVSIEDTEKKKIGPDAVTSVRIKQKDQTVVVNLPAPDSPGEYKVTMKITPHPEEANKDNNEISTYVQVIKEKIRILWADRPRVYEQVAAIRAIKMDPRFEIDYTDESVKAETLDDGRYDVLVVGDISASRFSGGKNEIFAKVAERVRNKMGLLMLGGEETFGKGGWQTHPELKELLPVDFAQAGFLGKPVQARLPKGKADLPFLQLSPEPKKNALLWKKLDPLDGIAIVGNVLGELLLEGDNGEAVMAAKQTRGRVVVFAADSTARSWQTPESIDAYQTFWKRLALWMSGQQDDGKQLWITLDKRRVNAGIGESLGFKFGLRDDKGNNLPDATFPVLKVIGPKQQEFDLTPIKDRSVAYQRAVFQGAKEPGEYTIVIKGNGRDQGNKLVAGGDSARFLVVNDDIEMQRPAAEHETLRKLADAAGGRFLLAEEAPLLAFLDELKSQVNSESRHKLTQWPDWNRLPASERTQDQLAGLWHSFALVGFLLFTALLGAEWLLRRVWGLV